MKFNKNSKLRLVTTLGYFSSLLLSACSGGNDRVADTNIGKPNTVLVMKNNQENKVFTNLEVTKVSDNKGFSQLHFSQEFGLLTINQDHVLQTFKNNQWTTISDHVFPNSPISASGGRISFLDSDQKYVWYENGTKAVSDFVVSPYSYAVHLGIANIVVAKINGQYTLTRVSRSGSRITIDNSSRSLFSEYTQPLQIDWNNSNHGNGHIVAYGEPTTEYNHYIFDPNRKHNFKKLFYFERHDMNDLRGELRLANGTVFEDDVFDVLFYKNKTYLVTTTANATEGARINLISYEKESETSNKFNLKIVASSQPIASGNRWISPIVLNNQIYANLTNDTESDLVKFNLLDLQKTELAKGISFHETGENSGAVYGYLNNNLFARSTDYQSLKVINLTDPTKTLTEDFRQKIIQIVTGQNSAFVRLADGTIHEIKPVIADTK
ncbi:hypothetical protein J2Z62_000675 [Mycoplasmoides fastidiosum]|uniref:Lipoprotein n=1 Tax=Mycoplasmoides fastidiosum TaxID=92758 RepID=A0ABU0LZV0_9BACT|nr:hypothetical protein [Mycoplasmoides fastidiosum]MDQ0514237.1 hypothetical protein [Mycoplasmoides fastidiosum]UUD37356.1 hypothetical protein NPA10_02105 [Mycoplasmoides fastidiosum]